MDGTIGQEIETIHIIFKTHLDMGFTDLAEKVVARYMDDYIPRAIETSRALRESGGEERFIWTTGSWILNHFLEHAPAGQRELLEQAIQAGDIRWHALPFTTHTELMDAELFRYGLSISHKLDQRFGVQTTAAKMTDVPGHTIAIVPLLAEAGVTFFHVGVNEGSTVPAVPPAFRWLAQDGSEVTVMYDASYGGLSVLPDMNDALYFAFTMDNLGPHSVEEVRQVYQTLREQYPGARLQASTLDVFARLAQEAEPLLPVFQLEIGDTWIHGTGSDPAKVSQFRALLRLRHNWLAAGRMHPSDPAYDRFSENLLLVAEHTWGLDHKTFLADSTHFRPDQLEQALQQPNFQLMQASWDEQRSYIRQALNALDEAGLTEEANQQLADLTPAAPDTQEYAGIGAAQLEMDAGPFMLRFDPQTGAIISLIDESGRQWAGEDHPIGLFRYQAFSQADYDRFFDQFIRTDLDWAFQDYSKPGMDAAGAVSGWLVPHLDELWRRQEDGLQRFVLNLSLPNPLSIPSGAPEKAVIELEIPDEGSELRYTLQWFNKPANRLPEALWFSFAPLGLAATGWKLHKLGQFISPLDVAAGGARKLHAVESGLFYDDSQVRVEIVSLDAPLVAPGEPALLDFSPHLPDLTSGMHFNLYNNVWGTNFPAWYVEDAKFRFTVRFL